MASGWYKQNTPDTELVKYAGGMGRAFAKLGETASDMEKEKRARDIEDKQLTMENQKYQDLRNDRQEDVNYRNKAYNDSRNDRKEDIDHRNKSYNDSREDTKFNQNMQQATFDLNKSNADRNFGLNSAKFNLMKQEYEDGNGVEPIYSKGVAFLPTKNEDGTISYTPLLSKKGNDNDAPFGYNEDGSVKTAQEQRDEDFNEKMKRKFGQTSMTPIDFDNSIEYYFKN